MCPTVPVPAAASVADLPAAERITRCRTAVGTARIGGRSRPADDPRPARARRPQPDPGLLGAGSSCRLAGRRQATSPPPPPAGPAARWGGAGS